MARLLYSGRPSKNVERRMIVEACSHLVWIAPLPDYGYIGFGGLEFVDFDMFHRQLGIVRMISIEKDVGSLSRYEFNRPFQSIEILPGMASEHLPSIDWERLHIVWLDYQCQLTEGVLRDCETVLRNAQAGSVLIVTVNASAKPRERMKTLARNVGSEGVPDRLTEDGLAGEWGFASGQWEILSHRLSTLARLRTPTVSLRQFLHFCYRDDARMQTIGWVLSTPGLDQTVDRSNIENLDFSRTGREPHVIKLPVLTRREIDYLNQKLPLAASVTLDEGWLDKEAQDQYADLYRWYAGLG